MGRGRDGMVLAIQALRAFAVLSVVIDHAFPGLWPGGFVGVDVFFVISGCLMTTHLVRERDAGVLSLAGFYLRRARRVLPAALLVLAATAVGTLLLLPPAWRPTTLGDIAAAAAYGVNWWLVARAVSYFAEGGPASPVKHFWSLSVEEQFYLVWPVLVLLAARLGRRGRGATASSLAVLLSAVVLLSFAAALVATGRDRTAAYFMTQGRVWEFALGGLAGLAAPAAARSGPLLRGALFLAAWPILFAAGFLLGPNARVPGLDIVPVTIATSVLLALGDQHGVGPAGRLIAWRPVQWLGARSYSLYLWHWPVLVFAPFLLGRGILHPWQAALSLLVSLGLAELTYRQVENRFRAGRAAPLQRRPVRALAGYLLASALVALAALGLAARETERADDVADRLFQLSQMPGPCFGGRAAEPGADCPLSHRLTDEDFALQTWSTQRVAVPNGALCQNEPGDAVLRPCEWGAAEPKVRRRIAMLGDSHSGMWAAAIIPFAEAEGIRILSYQASSCAATDDPRSFAVYLAADRRAACLAWRQAATAAVLADPSIDTVLVSANAHQQAIWTGSGWAEDDGAGFARLWMRIVAAGKRVVVIDDVPLLRAPLPDCLARPHPADDPCARPAAEVPTVTPLGRAVARLNTDRVTFLSLRDVFCDDALCHAIIGGIPAYMDADHISAPLARSLSSRLYAAIIRPANAP